jgi:hypothetical protein
VGSILSPRWSESHAQPSRRSGRPSLQLSSPKKDEVRGGPHANVDSLVRHACPVQVSRGSPEQRVPPPIRTPPLLRAAIRSNQLAFRRPIPTRPKSKHQPITSPGITQVVLERNLGFSSYASLLRRSCPSCLRQEWGFQMAREWKWTKPKSLKRFRAVSGFCSSRLDSMGGNGSGSDSADESVARIPGSVECPTAA